MYKTLRLSSPWIEYYKELKELFGRDPEISITFDETNYIIALHVDNTDKAEALQKLLPATVEFGNVTLNINVVPINHNSDDITRVYELAFKDNPVFDYTKVAGLPAGGAIKYAVFAKEVVQYYCDDISDVDGKRTTLYQHIADDILTKHADEIRHCTSQAAPLRWKHWSSELPTPNRGNYGRVEE